MKPISALKQLRKEMLKKAYIPKGIKGVKIKKITIDNFVRRSNMKGLIMKYFVLRPSTKDRHGWASIEAVRTYAKDMEEENPTLANELRKWMSDIETEKT